MSESINEIILNSTMGNTRIALVKNQVLDNLFVERPEHQRTVGNIYKGKVQNVIPGMQAAFIDIGQPVNAFLPFAEIGDVNPINNESFIVDSKDKNKKSKTNNKKINLVVGDDIIVQVIKEPFSGKGARVTTEISIPGSFMVLVPNSDYIGISKKISNRYEKNRIKKIISNFKPKNIGIIARTICCEQDEVNIKNDFDRLFKIWHEVKHKVKSSKTIQLIYQDFTISDLVIRDLFTESIKKLVIDSKPLYKRIYKLVKEINPNAANKIILHKSKVPIFDQYYGLDEQINKIIRPKVWLKSGAHLIIEHTEAMVVIDVNSGRFIGKKEHEDNSLKINIEAAKEIVRQLRLRDIGGLIVIDFIDLAEEKNRKKVYDTLRREIKIDGSKASLSEFSDFGLLQMTRQRVGLSILHTLTNKCKACNGLGRISSPDNTLTTIENWINKFRVKNKDRRLIIYTHKKIEEYVYTNKKSNLNKLMFKKLMWIEIKTDPTLNVNEFKVFSKKRKKEVTDEV
ncbi:MAG: ribonuclease G [Candidatus Marinimicrobia bacterium]|nr:ribonuclease G [Candidatus Neomarinimicrobiota bacterium]|tara:strand:+ start:15426 stop:16958 length:1533 start_codon:yes stop_codon:yes gene_type:complete